MALADGRPDVVFEWSERARALASRVSPVRPPAHPEAAANLAELRQLQAEILGSETGGGAPAALLRKARQLSGRIRQRAWYDAGSGLVTEPVGLPEIQGALWSADGALVCYLVGDGQLHALVAVGDSVQLSRLCSMGDVEGLLTGMQADLEVAAGRLPAAMLAAVHAALRRRLDRLCDILVTPLLGLVADRPLVVVQAASLSGVPWSILAPLVGRPLTVPRSATSWLSSRAGSIRPQTAGFVAGPRVVRAAEEVKRSAEAWSNPAVLTGSDAHCATVSQVASQVDVLHVAAHGRHTADNPLFSGLELVDGPWFGYDIDQLESIPSTVVLSACELGRSSVRWGEETIGMTVAWLHAGSRCVIAAPASVNDDAACELLATTHARLAAGLRPSEALAAAAEQLQSPAPAPFLCFGAGW
ncbi:MAG: CHAT domain-containing protein [Nocardioidaceae bacterium]|nr:CHAT domain-containing protein [Nocardioidaceae bacterium]